ncbi:MAG: PQQ-dependent sugar dehydrogenase [Gemmatimonadetes bacterium]|nr:PQQ-dependent sugar dehydrogenase [Gemmatimonadota bacterium]
MLAAAQSFRERHPGGGSARRGHAHRLAGVPRRLSVRARLVRARLVRRGIPQSRRPAVVAGAALCSALAGGCSDSSAADGDSAPTANILAQVVASGFVDPVHLTAPASDRRLFVVEQAGRIRIIEPDGRVLAAPFLDLRDRVRSGGERGLLSLAFHPNYAANGQFYVNYTDLEGDTRVERYFVSRDPNLADPGSAKLILHVDQPFANHNGGLVVFGPDGMLYIGMGDGGSAGDPLGHGQNRGTLLGALLRIDVNRGDPYAVPPDNPFVGMAGARGEIWAIGLRNPWRFTFDREAGLLYIADVGQNLWEEVNVVSASRAGLNFGWSIMEGAHCFVAPACDRTGLVLPVLEYGHDDGCSVTGGHVYHGARIPAVVGHYFYGDWCGGWIRSFRHRDGAASEIRRWEVGDVGRITSFGEDAQRELYVLSSSGRVYRLVATR